MRYVFGDYVLDARRYELRRGGTPIKLRPKVFDVLAYLIAHRERVVAKQELLEQLWPHQFIGDATLNSCIMEARQAVGDTGQAQQIIQTLYGRGYRFVAPVELPSQEPPAAAPMAPSTGPRDQEAPTQDHLDAAAGTMSTPAAQGHTETSALATTARAPAQPDRMPMSSLEGERKPITVLCCALANAMTLAAALGPDGMHGLMQEFLELAQREIQRYGGVITQCVGDGFMALFGTPVAHEDHARRGVLAALAFRRQLHTFNAHQHGLQGVELTVRMGLNTGMVVIGAIGDNLRMDYTAVGDTTNVAARLEQEAAPNQIVISEATHRLVVGYCTTRPLGTFALKGKTIPVAAWEVITAREARTRLEVEAERGLTPLVGRARELRTLHDCFAQARMGRGQVVFLVGEAGIGKSRLLLEFRHQLGEAAATWLEGRALSFGQVMAFHPLLDLLKRHFRLEEDDPEGLIIEKIEHSVLGLGDELRPTLPYLRSFFAVDPGDVAVRTMDPQLRRAELFAALRRWLIRAAEVRPQVLVVEDLQWMDTATEAALLAIADSIPSSRILCLFTYRPGYVQPFGERTYHTRLALQPLSSQDSMQMAQAILAAEQPPATLQMLIIQKAEGNPFFAEEVIKNLLEMGALRRRGAQYVLTKSIEDIVVPDTIQDVLMARIDRLDEAPKQTLQLAAVIGREFTYRLLSRLGATQDHTETSLQALKAVELIYEKSLFPELAYIFKHALTQDVAYNSLLVQRRQELHRLIGLAIEDLYADRLPEQYEVLAHHFARGAVWAKAFTYFCQAAEKAAQVFANREAITLYDQALEVASHFSNAVDAKTPMAIHETKSHLYFALSDFDRSRTEGERFLDLARRAGDRVSEGAALAGMGLALMWAHDLDRALTYARQAIAVAEAVDAKPVLAAGRYVTAFVHGTTGRLDEAKAEFGLVLTISQSMGDLLHQSLALRQVGLVENWQGEYVEATRLQSESLRIARAQNLFVPLLLNLFSYGVALTGKGDYDEALATFEEGLVLSEKASSEAWHHRILNSLGWLYSECGDLGRALDFNRRGAEAARRRGDPEIIANAELNLADIFLAQGNYTLAQEFLDGVYHLAHDPGTRDWMKWRYSMHLFASMGDLWLARGELAKAQEFADRCLALATRTTSRKYEVRGKRLRGEIALAQHQWEAAETWLRQALLLARNVGNPPQLWKTYVALGHLFREMQQPRQAQASYQAARDVIHRVKVTLHNAELRASLEQSPLTQAIYELSTSG